MNRIKSLVFLVVAAIFQTAPSLTAQQQVFDAKVPFRFSAGDRTLPAGEYRITRQNAFLSVQNRGNYTSALILASDTTSPINAESHLVFDHVNDAFFLRQVLAPAGSIELAVSRAEKKAIKDQHRLSTANPPTVTTPVSAMGGR